MRFADLDAVTLDAFGTLIALTDPVPALVKSLRERGIDVTEERVAEGFAAEGEYYLPRSLQGRDEDTLAIPGRPTCVLGWSSCTPAIVSSRSRARRRASRSFAAMRR